MKIRKYNENADTLYMKVGDKIIDTWYSGSNSKPFCWKSTKYSNDPLELWIGEKGQSHSTCSYIYTVFAGRLWFRNERENIDLNVISFWGISGMDRDNVKFCIDELSRELNINFYDWWLDLGGGGEHRNGSKLIKVKDFDGGIVDDSMDAKRIEHLKSAEEKERDKQEKIKKGEDVLPKGWGSRTYDDKLPKDMTPAQYKDTTTKYKYSESILPFKVFESPDTPKEFYTDEKGKTINFGEMSYSKYDAFPFGYVNVKQQTFLKSIEYKNEEIKDNEKLLNGKEIEDLEKLGDRSYKDDILKKIENLKKSIDYYKDAFEKYCKRFKLDDIEGFDKYPSIEGINEYDEMGKYSMLCGEFKTTHGDLGTYRSSQLYNGRIWDDRGDYKYISFWKYPETYEKLIEVLKDIQKSYKIKNNGELEILDSNNVPLPNWVIEVERDNFPDEVIPLSKYKGGKQRSAEEMAKLHFDPKAREAEVKRKLAAGEDVVKKGWGGRYHDDKLPKGMMPAEYKDKKTKQKFTESMDIKKFQIFESPDNIKIFSKLKNRLLKCDFDVVKAKPFTWMPKKDDDWNKIPRTKDGKVLMNINDVILYEGDFNKVWVGDFGEGHVHDCVFLTNGPYRCAFNELVHKGRLWFENKFKEPINAISFWDIRYFDADEMKKSIDSLSKSTGIDFENEGWCIDDPYINNTNYEEYNADGSTILTPIKEWYIKKQPKVIVGDELMNFKPEQKYTYDQDIKAKRDFYTRKGLGDSLVIKKFGDFLK